MLGLSYIVSDLHSVSPLQERTSFLVWRRNLALLEEEEGLVLTPFEKNLEVWRQLWRVLERSDIVVQVGRAGREGRSAGVGVEDCGRCGDVTDAGARDMRMYRSNPFSLSSSSPLASPPPPHSGGGCTGPAPVPLQTPHPVL